MGSMGSNRNIKLIRIANNVKNLDFWLPYGVEIDSLLLPDYVN